MPEIRPFRALRYDVDAIGDLGRVVSPPYDVIGAALRRDLIERHPQNIVQVDLPVEERGDEPDDRYRRAARIYAGWRADGTLHRAPRPSLYLYEQTYVVPGTDVERTQRGFFGRLRLEPFGPGAGVLPHERTLSGPKEDRYKLMRATGANLSPVISLFQDAAQRASELLAAAASGTPDADVVDDDGVRHRLWVLTEDGPHASTVAELISIAGSRPVTIADGHHRYETAIRYRDERRRTNTNEADPAYDWILMLFLGASEPLTVLPTHRLVRDLEDEGRGLVADVARLFVVEPVANGAVLAATFERAALERGGRGRVGLWTRSGGAILTARRDAFAGIVTDGAEAVRRLDVTLVRQRSKPAAGSTPRPRRPAGSHTRSRPLRRLPWWTPGRMERMRRCSSSPPRSARSSRSRRRATSCRRSRPTSTRRP